MNDQMKAFVPDWMISPPGATIKDLLEECGWTQKEFASRLDYTPKHVNLLIQGKAVINEETALKLERVLGGSLAFWLSREAQYREGLTRRDECAELKPYSYWLKQLPLKDMIAFGWLKRFSDKAQQIAEGLRFFGVASVAVWEEKWMKNLAAFRSPTIKDKNRGAIAAWIRQCELEAQQVCCQPFDAHQFKLALEAAKTLIREKNTAVMFQKLKELCSESGVALALVRAPQGCPAHGATCWMSPDKALLMLSDRYKTMDQFWFSFFHEAAHILFHAKKVFFIDTEGQLTNEDEQEANSFATNFLIPMEEYKIIQGILLNEYSINKYAKDMNLTPGIIVGRLQNEGVISWKSPLNKLKSKIEFC